MSLTTRGAGDDSRNSAGMPAPTEDEATISFAAGASSGQCSVCGADLAPDQRYCVECGNRRGGARFSLAPAGDPSGPPATGARSGSASAALPPRRNWTSSATLLVGIAVILLAIGVGVLIGHSNSSSVRNPGVHVTVNSGGGGTGAATAAGTAAGSGSGSTARAAGAKVTKQTAKANASAKTIAKHTGVNKTAVKNLPAAAGVSKAVTSTPVVKPGGACSAGTPGCTGRKETGNFFGG